MDDSFCTEKSALSLLKQNKTSKNDKIFIAFGYFKFFELIAWALQGPPSPAFGSPQKMIILIVHWIVH